MRFLHLADLHLGKKVNEFDQLEDARAALEQLVSIAKSEQVDAVVIAGDIYDKPSPSAGAVTLFDDFITALADNGAAVLAIPGNHDSEARVGYAARLLERRNVYMAEPFSGRIEPVVLADEHGPVSFWLLPFLKPPLVRPFFPDSDIGSDYTRAVEAVIGSCAIDPAVRNVAVAHQFVSFGKEPVELSGSELPVGGVEAIDAGVFDPFDYVALGHIHKSQAVGRSTMRYAGSLLKYSFSEALYEKKFPLVTLGEKGDVQIEDVRIKPLHDLREIEGSLAELTSDEVVAQGNANDYLHVTLTDEQPILDATARVRLRYPNMMLLDYRSEIERREKANDPVAAPLAKLSLPELFARFYESQFGSPLSESQEKLVADLFADAADPRSIEEDRR